MVDEVESHSDIITADHGEGPTYHKEILQDNIKIPDGNVNGDKNLSNGIPKSCGMRNVFEKYDLDQHIQKEGGVYICCHCQKIFRYFKSVIKHVLIHAEEKKIEDSVESIRKCIDEYSTFLNESRRLKREIKQKLPPKQDGLFGCPECGKQYTMKVGLQFHLRSHATKIVSDVSYACNLCETKFGSKEELNRHIKTHGSTKSTVPKIIRSFSLASLGKKSPNGKNTSLSPTRNSLPIANPCQVQETPNPDKEEVKKTKFPCTSCKKVFTHKLDQLIHLRGHMAQSKKPVVFTCGKCQERFGSSLKLRAHRQTHKNPKFSCSLCQRMFLFISGLKKHLAEAHINQELICEYCGKSHATPWALRYHLNMHFSKVLTKRKPKVPHRFPCQYLGCSKVFKKELNLISHVTSHIRDNLQPTDSPAETSDNISEVAEKSSPEKEANLPAAPPIFEATENQSPQTNENLESPSDENTLITCIKRESREESNEKYSCKICQGIFPSLSHLKKHRKEAHVIPKPFHCPYCTKCFSKKKLLKIHSRFHSDPYPFHCKFCTHKYTLKTQLKAHVKLHHSLDKEKKYTCTRCHQKFLYKAGLESHLNSQNQCQELVRCSVCPQKFPDKRLLEEHFRSHDPANQCNQCAMRCKNKVELEIHKQSHNRQAITLNYCTFCGLLFSTTSSLENHTGQHLSGKLPCACQPCHQVFGSVSDFHYHMMIAHNK